MPPQAYHAPGVLLQDSPRIFLSVLPGNWLLEHTTPSWRIEDPEAGFQRIVREDRAREMAIAVLDQGRTFPNAIVLATDIPDFQIVDCDLAIPGNAKFLVVDGQHRLWAQKHSRNQVPYACLIHMGLSEVEMARLFLEINDTQRRVPSSLRWDLVRLVRPEEDPTAVGASEIVYELATSEESPLFQRIDLTGEQPEIQLKQGSLAPEIKQLLGRKSPLHDLSFDRQYGVMLQFIIALKMVNSDKWSRRDYELLKARVLRALLKLLPDLIKAIGKEPRELNYRHFLPYLKRIKVASLSTEAIRAAQGNAGIRAIYAQLRQQVLH